MSSTEVAKVTRPAAQYWSGRVGRSFGKLAGIAGVLAVISGAGSFYWLVMRKKSVMDEYEAKFLTEEALKKKFDNMNKLKCFRSTQLDTYSWD